MATTVDQWIVNQYASMVEHLYQQMYPRLRQYVRVKSGALGERTSFDRLGLSRFAEKTERHSPTTHQDPDHTRRWVSKRDYTHSLLLGRTDDPEIIVNAQEAYVANGAMAKAVLGDQLILRAVEGNAYQGKDSTDTVVLPAGQKIANGGAGLTAGKFRQAREKHSSAEVGLDDLNNGNVGAFVAVVSPIGMKQLMADTEATNMDFIGDQGARMPLVNGVIPYYMGYRIVQHNELTVAADIRSCLFWHVSCVGLAIWEEEFMSIDVLPTMHYDKQIYRETSMNATRVQDTGVVQVDIDETK